MLSLGSHRGNGGATGTCCLSLAPSQRPEGLPESVQFLGDAREHVGAELHFVMKRKDDVRPVGPRQGSMRSRTAFNRPTNAQQGGQNSASLSGRPGAHAASNVTFKNSAGGDQDKAVPVQQSRQLMERLNETNVPARLVVREGVGHAYPGWEADAALIADWFDTHLRRIH